MWITASGAAGVAASTLLPSAGFAQAAWPARPVRIVVPYAPGGGNDALARVLAQKLEEQWGKPVVVENRSGGNTIIATEFVARQPADGYTILLASAGEIAAAPSLYGQNLPYDPAKDLVPITLVVRVPNLLVKLPRDWSSKVSRCSPRRRRHPIWRGCTPFGPMWETPVWSRSPSSTR